MTGIIRNALTAIVLGLLPFAVFIGSSGNTRLNGEIVHEEHLNVLGLVLATTGIVLVVRSLLGGAPRPAAGLILSGVAFLVCAAQLGASLGLYSPTRMVASLQPDADLPVLTYTGLDAGNRGIPEGIVARKDLAEIRRSIVGYKGSIMDYGSTHLAYADRCHSGRRRLDQKLLDTMPEFATEAERQAIAAEGAVGTKRGEALECSPSNTAYAMGKAVDDVHRLGDFVAILTAGYETQTKAAQ